jgi:hypothetical protein
MTLQTKRILTSAFFSVTVASVVAWAGSVTLPFNFTAGTTARASEVNANFAAVKTAVDDNNTRITALETITPVAAPTFFSGWSNVGGSWMTAGYWKDSMGIVHIRGLVRMAPGTAGNIFTLPAGMKPSANTQFPSRCGDNKLCYIVVNSNGNVDFGTTAGATPDISVTLDGISFDTR